MIEDILTPEEQKLASFVLGWAKSYHLVRRLKACKLIRVITPYDEEQYYTLFSEPKPRILFYEPVTFTVTVSEAQGECRAGHQPGDKWEFSWCIPSGMCGSAYHVMYPVLHGLLLTSGRYDGPAAHETLVTCSDHGWLTFRIERRRWTPIDWEQFIINSNGE